MQFNPIFMTLKRFPIFLMPTAFLALAVHMAISTAPLRAAEPKHSWETPGKDPDRIVVNLTDDPAHSFSVTWRTDLCISDGWVEYTKSDAAPGFSKEVTRAKALTQVLDISVADYNPESSAAFHSATLTGLEADTQYAYRVGDGQGFMSEWFHITTATEGFAPFSFVYVGDAQNGIFSHWSRLVRQAFKSEPDMAFFLHAGDLVNSAHLDAEWGQWFKSLGWINGMVPTLAVPGNHEYGNLPLREAEGKVEGEGEEEVIRKLSIQWQPQFEFPRVDALPEDIQETAYAIEYQGVLLVALNSMAQQEKQAEWLDNVLSTSNHQWKILTFHFPIFASASGRDNVKLRALWKPVIDRHNVDLVLQGHDHTYARGHTRLLKAGPEGEFIRSVYVNSVSGAKMYSVSPSRWTDFEDDGVLMVRSAENTQLFQTLQVDFRHITYKAITAAGDIYDAFTLEKLPDGSKKIVNDPITSTKERSFKNTIPY